MKTKKSLQSLQELGTLLNNSSNNLSKEKVSEILEFLEISFYNEDFLKEVQHKISYTFKNDFTDNYLPPVKVSGEYFLNILKENKYIFDRVNTHGIEVTSGVENYEIIYYAETPNDVMELYNEERKDIQIENEYVDEKEYINELDLYLGHIEWVCEKNNKCLFAFNTNIFKCDFLNDKLIFAFKGEFFVCFKK